MKKRVISMLLAVCMVVACVLAVTPAVSAENEATVAVTSASGDVGDIVEVYLTATTPAGEGFEFAGYSFNVQKFTGAELLYGIDVDGKEITFADWGNYWRQADANTENVNWFADEGKPWFTLVFQITSFVNCEVPIDIDEIDSLVNAAQHKLTFTTVPGRIETSGKLDKYTLTGEEIAISDDTGTSTSLTNTEKTKYGSNNGKKRTRTIEISAFYGDKVLLDNTNAYAFNDKLLEYYEFPEDGSYTTTGNKNTTNFLVTIVKNNNSLFAPSEMYFEKGFTAFDSAFVTDYALSSANVTFFDDYTVNEDGSSFNYDLTVLDDGGGPYYADTWIIDSLLRADPDKYTEDDAPCTLGTLNVWSGSGIWDMFHDSAVVDYITNTYGEIDLGLKELDEFKPIGHQLPTTESGIKGFRIDSEIKYADMVFDEKQVYQSAAVDFKAVVYDSNGSAKGAPKTMHKVIPAVYKSISSNNGPAIPASDGYYFSAVTVKGLDTAGLEEGDYIVFEVINTVTNCFEAETASDPVYFKYSFDGSVEQLTTAPAGF